MKSLQPLLQLNKSIYQMFAVIISGLLVCFTILYVSGSFSYVTTQLSYLVPRFPTYQKIKEIKDYSSQQEIFDAQPMISYNPNAKFLIVEISDINCPNCARFHGLEPLNGTYGYKRLKEDYIATGKLDYMFLDNRFLNDQAKQNSLYCVAEQDVRRFFEYKDALYQDYRDENETFTVDMAKKHLNEVFFDLKKFEDCFNSKKYYERIDKVSEFTNDTLKMTSTPSFLIFKVESRDVTRVDGSKGKEKVYTQLSSMVGNVDYELVMRPEIEKALAKN